MEKGRDSHSLQDGAFLGGELNQTYREIVDSVGAAIFIFSGEFNVFANPACVELTGYSRDEIVKMKFWEFIHPEFRELVKDRGQRRQAGENVPNRYELKIVTKQGEDRWIEFSARPIQISGKPAILGIANDISERKLAQNRVEFLAYHDALTGLPNRTGLARAWADAASSEGNEGRNAAILFLDLDRFKVINDSLGHAFGDVVLQQVAERLSGALHSGEVLSRHGGDEFTVFARVESAEQSALIAERIHASMTAPFFVGDRRIFLSTSIGIALAPESGTRMDELLMSADVAMYEAKKLGGDAYRVCTKALRFVSTHKLELEAGLRRALETGDFALHFQPRIALPSRKLTTFEVLVRWNRQGSLILPGSFIPIAEETGLIMQLGVWVLENACRLGQLWTRADRPFRLSVNVSPRQFHSNKFQQSIEEIILQAGFPAENLEIEITEDAVIANPDAARATLLRLKAMGVRVALDDFGKGNSSLGQIRRLPIDVLKIDRSLIYDIDRSAQAAAIIRAIVAIGTELGLSVVAEGVESEQQLIWLENIGCHEAQGFHLGHPLPSEGVPGALGWV